MDNQNVTLSFPKSLLKKAKMLATSKDKSLSGLIRETLEEKIGEDIGYNQARQRQLKLLKKGINLGTNGNINISREEVHARRQGIS